MKLKLNKLNEILLNIEINKIKIAMKNAKWNDIMHECDTYVRQNDKNK